MAPTVRSASRERPEAAASPRPAAVTTPPKTAPPPPSTIDAASLAFRTRMRRGSWVNVVMTLRWLHSPVNIRIATTGRRITSPTAKRRGSSRRSDRSSLGRGPAPASAQRSTGLRERGATGQRGYRWPWPTRPGRAVRTGWVLGPTVPRRCRGFGGRWTWSCCSLLRRSRLGGGEREEQLLQPVCLGLTQLGEQHLVVAGDAREHLGRDPTTGDVHGERISRPGDEVDPRSLERRGQCTGVGAAHEDRGAGKQIVQPTGGHHGPAGDDDEMISGGLYLVEQMTRQQHRAATVGEVAQERSHPGDALGIEPVRRFIEDQRPRIPDEGLGDAEALAHAQ